MRAVQVFLVVVLTLASTTLAEYRHAPRAVGVAELCLAGKAVMIPIDAGGKPVVLGVHCAECLPAQTALAEWPEPSLRIQPLASYRLRLVPIWLAPLYEAPGFADARAPPSWV